MQSIDTSVFPARLLSKGLPNALRPKRVHFSIRVPLVRHPEFTSNFAYTVYELDIIGFKELDIGGFPIFFLLLRKNRFLNIMGDSNYVV
jgi:hypothetical protein